MTVASYVDDLTDIFMWESTSGVSSIGGGAGAAAGVDFAMEGTNACARKISSGDKGFAYDNGTNFTIGSDTHFIQWMTCATPGICSLLGFMMGDSTSSHTYHGVAYEDHEPPLSGPHGPNGYIGGEAYVSRFYNTAGFDHGTAWWFVVGSPVSTTPSWIGIRALISSAAKGPNVAVDGSRYGTGYDVTEGTGADPEANFAGLASDDVTNELGLFREIPGGYRWQGKLRIGSSTTACEFLDSDQFIASKITEASLDDFTELLIENASTVVTLSNVIFQGFWYWNPGKFTMVTSSADVNLTGCTFQLYGDITLGTGATCLGCNFVNTGFITANGADLRGSLVRDFETTSNDSPLIWNTATATDGKLDDMEFVKSSSTHHAIEFGTISPTSFTLRDIDFSGFNASDAQNDSTLHIKRTTGTVTITIINCTGNISYLSAGADVVFIINPVTFQLHVTDIGTAANIQDARAYITTSDNTGTYPWEESVTISRVTTTATVAHTAHNLSDGNKVIIEGADQEEYNGVQTITNVSTNAYDYTVSGSPTTPATGTITSTAVLIDGLTDANGLISDFRPYPIDQPITGRVRKSSASPFYKTSPITGTIDDVNGLEIAVQMVRDE